MEAQSEKVKIMSAGAITAMLRRMAFEIYERNFGGEALSLVGIGPRGAYLADILAAHLREIAPLRVLRLNLVKADQGLDWEAQPNEHDLRGGTCLIVDDVLYTGSTVVQALAALAPFAPDKIQTAHLIDRGHHRFPVQANYVGMEIATSLKQYVAVEVDESTSRAEAYIF